jgi:hypothetical protein
MDLKISVPIFDPNRASASGGCVIVGPIRLAIAILLLGS